MIDAYSLLQTAITCVVLLFPVYNPIGSAFVLNSYFSHLEDEQRRTVTLKIAIYTFGLSLFFLFFGRFILDIFGVSVDVVRIAGGLFICNIAWGLLNPSPTSTSAPSNVTAENINNFIFTPFTFPITMAGGTISVLITIGAHSFSGSFANNMFVVLGNIIGLIVSAGIIFALYYRSSTLLLKIGKNGSIIVNKICAFFVFCVGLNIAIVGIKGVVAGV